jgi:hypothetical protein
MTPQEIADIFGTLKFKIARSTFNPHQYVVRGKCGLNDTDFDRLVVFLRRNGVRRGWGGKTYIVWYCRPDGFHYWTMGWPVRETTIINRANTAIADQTYPFNDHQLYSSPDGQKPEYAP